MKALILGLGNQGEKRKKILLKNNNFYSSVDPFNERADYKNINNIMKDKYDTVFICTPDFLKEKYIKYFLKKKKNIFVEKPLRLSLNKILEIKKISDKNNCTVHIGYNHRFEPHFQTLKKLIKKKIVGKILYLNIFYGNGTSKLISKSWRKNKLSIYDDIGSHIIDLIYQWFSFNKITRLEVIKNSLENKFIDHINIFFALDDNIRINIEISYCSWKNKFNLSLIGKKGEIRISNLCKWGPSNLEIHKRVLPSGAPIIKTKIIKKKDPTWQKEFNFFRKVVKNRRGSFDHLREIKINEFLDQIKLNIKNKIKC